MSDLKQYVERKERNIETVASIRRYDPEKLRPPERSDQEIDFSRILYSSSFRRLQGKMQFLIPTGTTFYRNRLTHSLEVLQLARTIAIRLGLKENLTVQCCALAHDLGNPPFGHAGEIILSSLRNCCPYEGNAQTFRVIDHLEDKFHDVNGLNLTLRTLFGIVKYPNNRAVNSRKFLYDEDFAFLEEKRKEHKIEFRTIDCEIMDLADEIAYAVHDLEDSLKMQYFSIEELLHEFENSDYKDSLQKLAQIVEAARKYASHAKYYKTSEEYAICFRKELTSLLLNLLVNDVGLIKKDGNDSLGFMSFGGISAGLKRLTFDAVKRRPDIIRYELLGQKVLTGLYQVYSDKEYNRDLLLLPAEYRDLKNRERTILDYIGGMMDLYAIEQHKIYFGESSIEKLYTKLG
jgi:dGTPase